MPWVTLLTPRRVRASLSQRLRLGLAITVRRGRLAGVAAVLRQAPFQLGDLGRQSRHFSGERLDPRYQRANQLVLLGNAESVKIGQAIHASLYLTFLALPQHATASPSQRCVALPEQTPFEFINTKVQAGEPVISGDAKGVDRGVQECWTGGASGARAGLRFPHPGPRSRHP